MPATNKILLVQQFRSPGTEQLIRNLEGRGHDIVKVSAEDASDQIVQVSPDFVIIDKFGFGDIDNQEAYDRLIAEATPPGMPLVELVDRFDRTSAPGAVQLAPPFHPEVVLQKLSTIARLKVIEAEMSRRAETAKQLGILGNRPLILPTGKPTLLLVSWGDRYIELERTLSVQFFVVGAVSVGAAKDYLSDHPVDGLMIDCLSEGVPSDVDVEQIRSNKRHFGLPINLIVPSGSSVRDVLASNMAIDDVYADPINHDTAARLMTDVIDYRHYKAWSAIARTDGPGGTARSALFDPQFFVAHRDRLKIAAQAGQPHMVAELRVESTDGADVDEKVTNAVGRLISMTSRGEDLASYLGDNTFAILMASTGRSQAETALRRITSIIEQTRLASGNVSVSMNLSALA